MRQSFFSLAILAAVFPGPALAQFKSWSKEQRTFERFSGALVSALQDQDSPSAMREALLQSVGAAAE